MIQHDKIIELENNEQFIGVEGKQNFHVEALINGKKAHGTILGVIVRGELKEDL